MNFSWFLPNVMDCKMMTYGGEICHIQKWGIELEK